MSASTWSFSQTFAREFQASRSDLEARIAAAAQVPPSSSQELLQEFSVELAKLVKNLVDATGSLPSYDQRQYEEQLKGIEKTLSDLRTKWTPKSRFAFKRKAPALASTTDASRNSLPVLEPTKSPVPQNATANLSLSSRSHQYLTADSLSLSDVQHNLTISDLIHCVVNLISTSTGSQDDSKVSHPPLDISGLHIRNLTDTVLLLPPINGSVLIHDLSRCTVVLGCHQFRMHTSRNVDVYLCLTSNPIIEHCSDIRFSGYPSSLRPRAGDIQSSQHLSVMDFSHIRPTPSPNWSILAADRIITQWTSIDSKSQENLDHVTERFLPK